jgi:hypothetical protein
MAKFLEGKMAQQVGIMVKQKFKKAQANDNPVSNLASFKVENRKHARTRFRDMYSKRK